MAKVDITGLLTGLAGTDLQQEGMTRASAIQGTGLGSNLARQRALSAPRREQMMSQGAGGLFGLDTRTAGEQVKEQLGQLDVTTSDGQKQAVQLVAQIDPTRALALQTQFNTQNIEAERYATAQALEQEKVDIQRERNLLTKSQLGSADKKAIRAATEIAAKAGARVSVLTGLADAYEKERPKGGLFGTAMSAWKKSIGGQDAVSAMKTRFTNVVNSDIINSLPPGVASDKDIEMAKSGFMNDSWNPDQIAQFLRGQAKLSAFLAERENMKAQWIDDNNGSTAGFNEAWGEINKQDEYKEKIRTKYSLSAYKIPLPDVEFESEPTPTLEPVPLTPVETFYKERAEGVNR